MELSRREIAAITNVANGLGERKCIWPAPYNVDTLEALTGFVLIQTTWNEAAKEFQQMPDRKYIREWVKKWYENRQRSGTMVTEKCRRMVISWVSRSCELWDMGLRRGDFLLVGEDLEAAAKQMWRYDCLYGQLKKKNPTWKLPEITTHKYAGERQLKSVQLANGSKSSYANGESNSIQGDGLAGVVCEEPSLYPYATAILAQSKIVTQGASGGKGGYVNWIANAKAENKNWQSMKQLWIEEPLTEICKGMTVRVTGADEWFVELDWWADENRDAKWLEETRKGMLSTPFEFREQILRQDTIAQGALWAYDLLNSCRIEKVPQLVCIALSVDPSVSDPEMRKNPSKEVDECGIIISGIDGDAKGYVLSDLSLRCKPSEWARIACGALQRWAKATGAPRWILVAEKNQGGEMVKEALQTVWHDAPVHLVHASIGKRARAEPVAALYEQGRIFHVGRMNDLEREMTAWNAANPAAPSPNRIDALCQGFHAMGLCGETQIRTVNRMVNQEAKDEDIDDTW